MITSCIIRVLWCIGALLLLEGVGHAGPKDLKTNYRVIVGLAGGSSVGGIHDSGGVTSLSFVDAVSDGLLTAGGDPARPADGSGTVGGTGGGGLKYWQFDNVTLRITPSSGGGTRTVVTTVIVPQKPANQTGAPPVQQAKTNSLGTKIGKNTTGMQVGGGQLETVDGGPSIIPGRDIRYTRWSNPKPPLFNINVNIDLSPGGSTFMPGVRFNGATFDPAVTTLAPSLIPTATAVLLGITPQGTDTLDYATESALYIDGFLNTIPDPLNLLTLSFGYADVTLPAVQGAIDNFQVAVLINPETDALVLGADGLIPEGYGGWFDNAASTFNLERIPEPPVLGIMAAALAWLGLLRLHRSGLRAG